MSGYVNNQKKQLYVLLTILSLFIYFIDKKSKGNGGVLIFGELRIES